MQNTFNIALRDLRFYSRIGVGPQEREVGNEFSVDVEVEYDAGRFVSERLETTISYADIYDIVASEMAPEKEWLLLESVAVAIAGQILERWDEVERGKIRIAKLAVPLKGIHGSASVEYRFVKKSSE